MHKGGKILGSVAIVALTACSAQQGKLEIRATAAPISAGQKPVPVRVAEGRGQLALGNVALALESFRKAAREDPSSIEALLGVAESYDQMGRYDLSRRSYESALALAPGDTRLLGALAASLQLQGLNEEAASVRHEIAERMAAVAPAAPVAKPQVEKPAGEIARVEPVKQAPAPAPAPAPVEMAAVAMPVRAIAPIAQPAPAKPVAAPVAVVADVAPVAPIAPLPKPVKVAEKAPAPIAAPAPVQPVKAAEPAPAPVAAPAAAPTPAPVKASPAPVAAEAMAKPIERVAEPTPPAPVTVAEAMPVGRTVTIKLPAPRPASDPVPTRDEAPAKSLPAILAEKAARRPAPQPVAASNTGPHIERLSMGEVALITGSGLRWRAQALDQDNRSATVRFVPIRQASAESRVRLLNAARVNRLAARTRAYLAGRGWQSISIGDAALVRSRSLIVYPSNQRVMALKLSKQFGYPIAHRPGVRQVTVLLGRDAAKKRIIAT